MSETRAQRPFWVWAIALVAVVFGILTIKSGAAVLFFAGEARAAAGNYVEFVVWFNFLAGFAYIASGAGIWLGRGWAPTLALLIAVGTLLLFGAFGIHVFSGGQYETRTIGAMTLRSTVWVVIAFVALRWLPRRAAVQKA